MTFNIKTDIKFELYLPASGDFVLGISELGGTDVLSSNAGSWVDIAANLASINTSVGPQVQSGIYTQSDPGMISATFQSATYDPNFNGLVRAGIEVRIQAYQNGAWFYMFRGRIADLSVVYNYDGSNVVTLLAYDYLQRFMNEIIENFSDVGGYNTGLMVEYISLLANNSLIPLTYDLGVAKLRAYSLGDYSVGTIANDCVLAELGLFWYESRDNRMNFRDRNFIATQLAGSATYDFSDVHSTATSHVCYSDVRIGASSDQLTNVITATYDDGTGEKTRLNRDSYQLYGPQNLDIALPLWQGGTDLFDWIGDAVNRPVQKTVQEITFKGTNRTGDLYSATKIKVGDVVSVVKTIGSNTIDEKFVVTNVRHSINPDVWQTTLELWKGI
jgi:hypothetical protein